jgi:hypothetical protein
MNSPSESPQAPAGSSAPAGASARDWLQQLSAFLLGFASGGAFLALLNHWYGL